MTDEQITKAAREICAAQAAKSDSPERTLYRSGAWDHTVWMRLVERGIRRGLEGQAMVKTQHCPNCEATEQKLHDFRQEVSDAITDMVSKDGAVITNYIGRFIITKPKPDPLVEAYLSVFPYSNTAEQYMAPIRAALDDLGFEIREKGQ